MRGLAGALLAGLLWAGAAAQAGPVPRNLAIVAPAGNAAENQLDLRWEPVPGALGYEVLQKRNGNWWLDEDDPNRTPMTSGTSLTGLRPDTEYEFCVRALLSQGRGPNSPPIRARTAASSIGAGPAPERPSAPLPLPAEEPPRRSAPAPVERDPEPEPLPVNGPISDLVPPPPKPAQPAGEPKGPPPPAPEGMMSFWAADGKIRLSWRKVSQATGYLVEEEKSGNWVTLDQGVIADNQPWILLKGYPGPGPYYFRVRATRYGQRSGPSFPTRLER